MAGIVRPATGLAVDGHQAFGTGIVADDGLGDPRLEAALKGLGLQRDEQTADAIPRRDAIGQRQVVGQPFVPLLGPAVHGRRTIAAAHNGTHGEHRDIDEVVFAVAGVSGIGERFEIRPNGANVDELRHERNPCKRSAPARPEPTGLATNRSPFDTKISAEAIGDSPPDYLFMRVALGGFTGRVGNMRYRGNIQPKLIRRIAFFPGNHPAFSDISRLKPTSGEHLSLKIGLETVMRWVFQDGPAPGHPVFDNRRGFRVTSKSS